LHIARRPTDLVKAALDSVPEDVLEHQKRPGLFERSVRLAFDLAQALPIHVIRLSPIESTDGLEVKLPLDKILHITAEVSPFVLSYVAGASILDLICYPFKYLDPALTILSQSFYIR
jgi:hypothetical protein